MKILEQFVPFLKFKRTDNVWRKIYVAVTQQKMLKKTLRSGKANGQRRAWVKAYNNKIADIHAEELYHRSQRVDVQKEVWKIESQERRLEKRLSSFPGDIYINIDKYQQTMEVYKGNQLIYSWLCSTGKNGYETPYGEYKPYHTEKLHLSKQWDDAKMPYSVFFHEGYAIHGTNYLRRLGSKASHGCIRLSNKNAKKIYNLTRKYGYSRINISIG